MIPKAVKDCPGQGARSVLILPALTRSVLARPAVAEALESRPGGAETLLLDWALARAVELSGWEGRAGNTAPGYSTHWGLEASDSSHSSVEVQVAPARS